MKLCLLLATSFCLAGWVSCYEHHLRGPSFLMEPPSRVEFSNTSGGWIDCTASGSPPPAVDWVSVDGSSVTDVMDVRRVLRNGTLVLLPFNAAAYRQDIHNTVYRCVASNGVGRVLSRDVQVRAVVAQAYKVNVEVLSASRGCTAVLRCMVPSFVKDLVKVVSWVQDPATYIYPKLQGDGKFHVLPTGELLVHNLQSSDQYPQYRCRTMHKLTRQVVGSAPASIRITDHRGLVSPAIIEHTGSVHVAQDEGAVLLCVAQSCPSPDYQWFVISGPEPIPISPPQGSRTKIFGPILAIEAVTGEDSGMYRCSATNSAGEASAELRLVVTSPLHVEVTPSMLSVHLGGTAEFKCNIHSQGQYTGPHMISWLKDGRPLPGAGRHNSDHFILNGVSRDDRGMYQCVVRRAEGETAQSAGELQLGDAPPVLLYSFIEQTLQPGPSVSLKCSAAGNPTPQIAWTLDGFPLPNNGRFVIGQYMTVHGDVISHVNISQAAVEDGGEYTCTAENRAGKVSHSSKLNIYGLPYIRLIPKVTAVAGEAMRLKCPVAGYPIEEIRWEQGGKQLPSDLRQKVEQDGTLVISGVQKESDVGVYTCWARNKQGQSARRSGEVAVIVPPKLSPSYPDSTMNAGERASLTCSVTKGDLPMSIAWLKDGRTVDPQTVQVQQVNEFHSILLIESLSQEHNGNYSCIARNAAAEVSHTTQLLVNVPPIIEPFSFQDGLSEGMRTRTVCGVSQGDPPLTISWLKDGTSFPPHLAANYSTLDAYSSLLSIPSLTSAHSGDYTCVASNPAAELRYTAKLQVKVPPKWVIEPTNVANVERNKHIILHCQAEGVPKPTIIWKKDIAPDGKSGEYEELRERMYTKLFSNGSLLLQNVKEDRKGTYLCQANNGIGGPIGKMVQLRVNSPPYFTGPSRQVTVKKGDIATLQCDVSGDTPITVTWLRNGNVELTPQTNYRVSVKQELIRNGVTADISIAGAEATDSGTYFCQASNLYGREQQMVQLLVQEPPQSPIGLEAVAITSRSASVQWKRPSLESSDVTKYMVQYREGEGGWQHIEVSDQYSATIEDLKPATRYSIRVIAEGTAGRSPPTSEILLKTEPQRPAGPPLHINVRPLSSTEILLTWSPPLAELRHGEILGYNIGYRETNSGTSSYTFTNVSGDAEEGGEMVLSPLAKFTRYSIVVQAFNQVGPGPLSEPISTQTFEDVPSMAPEDVRCAALSPQSLQVSWQPPAAAHSNGILQGYKVHVEPLHEDITWEPTDELELDARKTTALTMVVSGLRKYTNYSVQVLAFTRMGDGVLTRPSFCQTEEDAPGPPSDIKVVVSSPQSLLVSWLPPRDPNGVIIKYNLYTRTVDSRATELNHGKHYLPTQLTSYEAKNLQQQVEYQFYVTASTRVGEGHSSRIVAQIPANRVPARISSFGGGVVFPWQGSATLPCTAVGMPEPRREWFKGDQSVRSLTHQILESGELVLTSLQPNDGGNYTCQVDNPQGSDRVVYSLTVQVPPAAPILYISSATSSTVMLHWKPGASGGAAITSYLLNYRKSNGDQDELLLPRRISSYEVKNLICGSTYHLYLIAQNKIGSSPPSTSLTVRTQGEAPGVPQGTTLIQPNSTSVLLRLHVWPDNGCPLLYFVLQYRASIDVHWTMVSNSLKPQKRFVIQGLNPSSVYQLKIEAHNIAGSSMAEFTFITLTKDGDPPPPELVTRSHSNHSFFTDVRILIPLLVAITALFAALFAAAFCWRNSHGRPLKETLDNQHNTEAQRERYYATIHKVAMQANSDKIPETSEDISPYATFQLSEAGPPTNSLLHSFMYHEQALTEGCASPPPAGLKVGPGRRRSRGRKQEADSEDSDSDPDQLTSSRTESSNQLDAARSKQNFLYHGAQSSTSSDISPMSEVKSLPRRGRNRPSSRWPRSAKAETSFSALPLGPATPDRPELSEAECDIDTIKKLKLGLRSSLWTKPTTGSNQSDYSIAV